MPDEEKLQREENLRRKREAERLRYNKIKTDPQLSASQTLKEKEKYLRKKEAKQIKLIKDMTDFEHQMKKQQWRYNSSAYYKRKKSKRAGDSGVEMMRKNEKLESCIERLKSRSIRLFIPANQMVT